MERRTSVWWDIDKCDVPTGFDPHCIVRNIAHAVAAAGFGTLLSSISAYGDVSRITPSVHLALSTSGVRLHHVPSPSGDIDASDKKILIDMLLWAVDNPQPANYLIISGDVDFVCTLHQLRMRRYRVLLAHGPNVSQTLVAVANRVWLWRSLMAGGPPLTQAVQSLETNGWKFQSRTNTWGMSRTVDFEVSLLPTEEDVNGVFEDFSSFMQSPLQQRNMLQSSTCTLCGFAGGPSRAEQPFVPPFPSYLPSGDACPKNSPGVKLIKVAPHKFFDSGKHDASSATSVKSDVLQPCFTPKVEGKSSNDNCQFRATQLLRPGDTQSKAPGSNGFCPYPANRYRQSSVYPSTSLPDVGKLSISSTDEIRDGPTHSQYTGPPLGFQSLLEHNQSWNQAEFHVTIILLALHMLEVGRVPPTQVNIADCIRFGEINLPYFDIQVGLEYAMRQHLIETHYSGTPLPLYTQRNTRPWEWVNIWDNNAIHPKATWDALQSFLSSSGGRSAMLATKCSYQAATLLKKCCLDHLSLGEVFQILNLAIKVKKWIVPPFSGWQPLTLKLHVCTYADVVARTTP